MDGMDAVDTEGHAEGRVEEGVVGVGWDMSG